ncbi:MAG: hypothetical protein PVI43_01280 [Candidatus Bathyarchaeota archaeon]|jgi:hypothetical protein
MNNLEMFLRNPVIRRKLGGAVQKFGYAAVAEMMSSMPQRTMAGINAMAQEDQGDPEIAQQRGRRKEQQKARTGFRTLAQMGMLLGIGGVAGRAISGLGARFGGEEEAIQPDEILARTEPPQPPTDDAQVPQIEQQLPEQTQQPAGEPETQPPSGDNLADQALQGINPKELSGFQRERISKLINQLQRLQSQGKGLNDRNVRNLITRIREVGKGNIAEREMGRLERAYPEMMGPDVDQQIEERIGGDVLQDTPKLEDGDIVRTKKGQTGRVIGVDPDRGIARVKIDKKVHNKKIDDLTQIPPSEIGSSFIDTKNIYYSPDTKSGLVRFLQGPWYGYQNIDESDWENFTKGKGTTQTEGVGPTGIRWWKNKNPSVGRAFWNFIRNNESIPYARIGDNVNPEDFFAQFNEISPGLDWKIPQPVKKKKRKKR